MAYIQAAEQDMQENLASFGNYRLMTAEIVFDGEAVTWRDYDVTPGFPRLRAFIDRWRDDPAIRVRSVTVLEIEDAHVPACRISPSTSALH